MAVRHHVKVLVIDDDPSICKTVGLLLEDRGYNPRTYTSPEEAIEAAREESFQIALIDLRMPSMDGVEVVGKLKAIDERMSCIVMTAYPDLDSATETMRQGSCDYIAKPFKQDELVASIDRACQRMGIIYTDETELNRLIGQRIRSHRLSQNLTLRQLSDRTDLTTSQLSQVELGKNAASIWALARISNALGLQVSELLDGL
ncbi:MAG: response regulator [Planctomycetes bacterium]|nr:response regulator [Planctomycetota bacterium]MCH7632179.1 response regulator [Planctomycetota bacterium]